MGYVVELKFSINKADANKLHRIPVIVNSAFNQQNPHKISSIYFDTPHLQLLEAGVTLCIRHEFRDWIQSIKLSGGADYGLHELCKWESLVHTGLPDFTKIKHPILIEFFSNKSIRSALIPIFKTDVMQTLWQLAFENGDQLELSLDSGLLTSNQQPEPINTLVLSLKAGNIGRIFDIALLLQKAIPLNIENASTARRGCVDYLAGAERACKSQFIILNKSTPANIAFKKIVLGCINHLESNRNIVLMQSDIEGIHQMRVALRRLRSAFTIFKGLINAKESRKIFNEVNWLAATLGKVRDLDVLITETLPIMTNISHNSSGCSKNNNDFLMLREQALAARLLACESVHEALRSQRYHRLLLLIFAWLENERWLRSQNKVKNCKLQSLAKQSLNKLYKRLLQGKVQNTQPEARHAVRVLAKKLRYASEFFFSLYSPRQVSRFIKKLAKLQDSLGLMNDIDSAGNLLRSISGLIPDAGVIDAIDQFEKRGRKRNNQEILKVGFSLQKLCKLKPFWMDSKSKVH